MTEYVISLADLLEAEGRTLRLNLVQMGAALALLAAAAILICAGLALCLWGAYVGISASMGPTGAALFIGVLSFVAAGLLAWTAILLTR